jgi:hypothetical protein
LRDVDRDRGSLFELDEVDLRGRVELCEDGERWRRDERGVMLLVWLVTTLGVTLVTMLHVAESPEVWRLWRRGRVAARDEVPSSSIHSGILPCEGPRFSWAYKQLNNRFHKCCQILCYDSYEIWCKWNKT